MNVDIAVVICTHNRHALLADAITSVLRQSLARERYVVIVVDNSTEVGLARRHQAKYQDEFGLKYLIESEPGLANARNRALRDTDAEFIAFMDDDARADREWLEGLLAGFARFGKTVGVVGGRVDPLWPGPVPRWLAGDAYADAADLSTLEWENHVRPMVGNLSVVNWGGPIRPVQEDEWLAGTNICFRAAPLRELGGFDPQLGRKGAAVSLLSNEESAVMRKLIRQGWQAIYAPDARVRHLVAPERLDQKWFARRLAWQVVSDLLEHGDRYRFAPQDALAAIAQFKEALPPGRDPLDALFDRFDTPQLFDRQMFAIAAVFRLLLTGAHGADDLLSQDRRTP